MPKTPGISRRALPSRSLCWACRYFTIAWAVVRRMVPFALLMALTFFLGQGRQAPGSSDLFGLPHPGAIVPRLLQQLPPNRDRFVRLVRDHQELDEPLEVRAVGIGEP